MLSTMMRHPRLRRPGALLLAVGLSTFGVAATATAHAELVTPTPADGADVIGQPAAIGGIYSESMSVDGSSLKLLDASGKVVATGGVVSTDDKRMAIDPVPELGEGAYTVQSTTTSAQDGDIDRTTWTFTVVLPPTSEPTTSPAPSTTTAQSLAPSTSVAPPASAAATPAPSGDSGNGTASGGDVLLPIVAALVIIVGIGAYLYGRRDRSTPSQP
jgi:methionine-rich copper-binding protein CopC